MSAPSADRIPAGRATSKATRLAGAAATVALAVVAVVSVAGAGAVATGRWWQPSTLGAQFGAPAEQAPVAHDDSPARRVVDRLIERDPLALRVETATTPGVRTTTRHSELDRCDTTSWALAAEYDLAGLDGRAASVGTVSIEVTSAGLGQRSLDNRSLAAQRCGASLSAAPSPGVAAVEAMQSGRWWLSWRRGDVIVRVVGDPAAATALREHAVALDRSLSELMAGTCLDPAAPADAAVRNPSQPDHRAYTLVEPVSAPIDVPPPDPALLERRLPAPDDESMRLAVGPTFSPTPPVVPAAGVVDVPAVDRDGPGCGWAFSAMLPPADSATVSRLANQARSAATDELRRQWAAWPDQVTRWQRLRAAQLALQRARAEAAATTVEEAVGVPTTAAPAPAAPITPPVNSTTPTPTSTTSTTTTKPAGSSNSGSGPGGGSGTPTPTSG